MKPYSPQTYRTLLELLKAGGYRFAEYSEIPHDASGKLVYLRHDIDYSIDWAVALAEINADAGACATFFFQLRSPNYNINAYSAGAAMRKICVLGQRIGLHFSLDRVPAGDQAIVARVTEDHSAMRAQVQELAPVFSWHNPSVCPGLLEKVPDIEVPGLVNTYARRFLERVTYCSESNLRYSVEELESVIQSGQPRLQLLFHPFQWLAGGRDMQEVLANTWVQVLREKEQEFLTNHVYRGLFPSGIHAAWLSELARCVAEYKR